jgi:ubiquinone/menaquinone biosynthesis C-methylase UbiE
MGLTDALFGYIENHHPRSLTGIHEAREVSPERFDALAERMLGWAQGVLGDGAIARTVDAFVQFSLEVNLAQARYEASGHYEHSSFKAVYESVYSRRETMDDYLWGVYLTNFLWAHHMKLSSFYEGQFLAALRPDASLVEIAPGHGGWGLWALDQRPSATLEAFDISPSSIAIARALAKSAGLDTRATYTEQNALELKAAPATPYDACICSFLIEHLEAPDALLEVMHRLLAPRGKAFLTAALTAAQVDHIYELQRESEVVLLAERHGFRVLATLSVAPARTLRNARFLPRSMGLVLEKRTTGTW